MRSIRSLFVLAALSATSILAQAPSGQPAPDMNALGQMLGAMMSGGTNAAALVDFRELKGLLPAEVIGLKRTKASGEKNSAMGMAVATAEGDYTSEAGEHLTVKISDMGGTGGLMGMMHAGWAMAEVDRETDTGYERTTTINGNKAMEKYDSADKRGEVQVLVNKRFMVEVSGYNITEAQLKDALGKIDLSKLATLQPKPAAAPAP